jgi:hypothetical protein
MGSGSNVDLVVIKANDNVSKSSLYQCLPFPKAEFILATYWYVPDFFIRFSFPGPNAGFMMDTCFSRTIHNLLKNATVFN